jgi:carbamoyl-phosphate synthase small subunit
VENIKALLGKKPMFGICMGHQIIGQVVGGKTFKLKFGHHGANHPIRFNTNGGPLVSAQKLTSSQGWGSVGFMTTLPHKDP